MSRAMIGWRTFVSCAVTVGLLSACGGGDGPAAPPAATTTDSAVTPPDGTSPVDGDRADGVSPSDGAVVDGAGDGAVGDGGDGGGLSGVCASGHEWKFWRNLVSAPINRFGGISAIGQATIWTLIGGAGVNAARRTSELSDFGLPTGLSGPTLPRERVALDPSGDSAVAFPIGKGTAVVWLRSATFDKWGLVPTDDRFANVLAALPADTFVTEPVLGASGTSFVYLYTPRDGTPVLYESQWDVVAAKWKPGVAVTSPGLASVDATHRRRPTGMSVDDLTLFFFDETVGIERAAWRATRDAAFTYYEDLTAFPEAAPNAACSYLYFKGTDSTGSPTISVAQ